MATFLKLTLDDGSPRWKAIVRRKWHPVRTRTFRTRAQSEAWAKRVEVSILDGRLVPDRSEERRTVGEVIDRYISEVVPRYPARDQKKRMTHLNWWSKRLGDVPLLGFSRSMATDGLRALDKGDSPSERPASPATCNRYLATLRHVFSFAMKELEWIPMNPVSGMGRREPRGRVRFLDDDEKDALLKSCLKSRNPRLYPLVVLALSTGARQAELMGLRWRDVDFERGVAVLHHTKNRERRAVPLEGEAVRVLRELAQVRRIDSDLVFYSGGGPPRFPKEAFAGALKRAGIHNFRFHDLRHTAASYLAMSGATLSEIAEILGHKTLAMVKRYSHLTEQHTSGVVARMNRRFLPAGK